MIIYKKKKNYSKVKIVTDSLPEMASYKVTWLTEKHSKYLRRWVTRLDQDKSGTFQVGPSISAFMSEYLYKLDVWRIQKETRKR